MPSTDTRPTAPVFHVELALADIHFDTGSKLIRTASGWRVERVTAGGAPQVGEGKSIERAFAMIGATHDQPDPETGVRVLRDALGNILAPE